MSGRRVGSLAYSPLCDTDLVAYTRYLESNVAASGRSATGGGCGRGDGAQDLGCGSGFSGGLIEVADIASGADEGGSQGCVVSRGAVGLLRSFIASEVQESVRQAVDKKYDEMFNGSGQRTEECRTDNAGTAGTNRKSDGAFVSNGSFDAGSASGLTTEENVGLGDVVVESDDVGLTAKYVPPHARGVSVVRGPKGGVSLGRGKNYEKNQAARDRRRCDKLAVERSSVGFGTFAACSVEQRGDLQQSRAERLVAENRLKAAEAQQRLELLRSQDLAQLKKRQETKLMRDTELNKVQVEQAFGKLAGTGNVPGFAQTVVSSEGTPQLVSGSISPNSSVSMAEVHAMQKENLEYRRRMEVLLKESPDLHAKVLATKLPSEKTGWSIGENGWPKGYIGDGVGGMIGPDGRLHDYDDYADY